MSRTLDVSHLPGVAIGTGSLLWCGVVGMLLVEATVFVLLVVAYFYLRMQAPAWPPETVPPPDLVGSSVGVGLLVASLWPMHRSEKATSEGERRRALAWLGVGSALALAFLATRVYEWQALPFSWDDHPYGSIVWVLLGFHTLHFGTELVESAVAALAVGLGWWGDEQRLAFQSGGVYWVFVVAAWIPLWVVLYLVPRL